MILRPPRSTLTSPPFPYTALFRSARKRHGVDIRTDALVTSLLLEGRRSTGVMYRRDGVESRVMARRGVIVCAGTINSPKLLQLSGIGSASVLQQHGIKVRHRSEEHTSELQSLMRISYAVFC